MESEPHSTLLPFSHQACSCELFCLLSNSQFDPCSIPVKLPSRLFLVLIQALYLIGAIHFLICPLNRRLEQSHGTGTEIRYNSHFNHICISSSTMLYNLVNILSVKLCSDYTKKHSMPQQSILKYYAFKLKCIEIKWREVWHRSKMQFACIRSLAQ